MSEYIDGLEQPNPGITRKECCEQNTIPGVSYKPYECSSKHRDDEPHVSFDDYQDWMSKIHVPGTNSYRHLRWGQAFCNHFSVHDEGLYYETSPIVASHTIWTHYIDSDAYSVNRGSNGEIL